MKFFLKTIIGGNEDWIKKTIVEENEKLNKVKIAKKN